MMTSAAAVGAAATETPRRPPTVYSVQGDGYCTPTVFPQMQNLWRANFVAALSCSGLRELAPLHGVVEDALHLDDAFVLQSLKETTRSRDIIAVLFLRRSRSGSSTVVWKPSVSYFTARNTPSPRSHKQIHMNGSIGSWTPPDVMFGEFREISK
jgi:hypothetical protein